MINLLPIEEGLALKRLYRRRLLVSSLAFLFFLIVFSAAHLLPTYFIFSVKLSAVRTELKELNQKISDQGTADLVKTVDSVNRKLKILSAPGESLALAEILEKTVGHSRQFVSLGSVIINSAGEVVVSGTAASRQRFLDFTRLLEKEPFFSRIDSPISNLVAVKDINFRLTLTVASSSRTY